MKFFSSHIGNYFRKTSVRRTLGYFLRFLIMFIGLLILYSVLFHYIMEYEGKEYSAVTGLYWTLTVMSTLGFGDIVFVSDLGRAFSIIVLISGTVLLLVMLPFAFIQYGYSPWIEAQKKNSAPRLISHSIHNHIIIVGLSPLSLNLAKQLTEYGFYCILLCPNTQTAFDVEDQGYNAVVGDYDDDVTYRNLRVRDASMLIALDNDMRNTNTVFSAREVDAKVQIVARAAHDYSEEILTLAGSSKVFRFRKLLGESLAGRVIGNMGSSSYLTGFASLTIAETNISNTNLAGKTLRECSLREQVGVNIIGMWEKGVFTIPMPNDPLPEGVTLVLAGTEKEFVDFEAMMASLHPPSRPHVLILGGGEVGIAAAKNLHERNIDVVVVDKFNVSGLPSGIPIIHGDATDIAILKKAGIETASSVIITPNDDDINIYLTIYCRKLRPDIQILSRASLDRNVSILHKAGANVVLSLVSLLTNNIVNLLAPGKVLMLSDGLFLLRTDVNKQLVGKKLLDSQIRKRTRCSVVGIHKEDGTIHVNPSPEYVFSAGEEMYLIGDNESQKTFIKHYGIKNS